MDITNTKRSIRSTGSILDFLRKLAPPETIIHAGAGNGTGELHLWQQWNIAEAWLVDADNKRLQWAEKLSAAHPRWHVVTAALAGSDEEQEFHQASNPEEDGLVPPEQLKKIWPNLNSKSRALRKTQRLDQLIAGAGAVPAAPWLLIDCLPPLHILQGAGTLLDHCNVLCVRVVLKSSGALDDSSSLAAVQNFLGPRCFRLIDTVEGNHPAMGHAIFVRDWQKALQLQSTELAKISASQQALTAQHQEDLDRLAQARDQYARQTSELQSGIEAQAKLARDQQDRLDSLAKELATVTSARDQQIKLASEKQAKINELMVACDAQDKQASELQSQNTQLSQTQVALEMEKSVLLGQRKNLEKELAAITLKQTGQAQQIAQQLEEIATLKNQLDTQTRLASQLNTELTQTTQKDAAIAQLHAEIQERDSRQQRLNDEITRAEAQLDLIKDVLLREPGL